MLRGVQPCALRCGCNAAGRPAMCPALWLQCCGASSHVPCAVAAMLQGLLPASLILTGLEPQPLQGTASLLEALLQYSPVDTSLDSAIYQDWPG
ncbi:hypothetical protein P7K49_009116 [Saguinus oedipus]|uniref:Uncharacterized protein n=1 Tax=Saguinus oedipus TaxID=9490 RepID=A0ABQ9W0A5_SAGOE|nr:hypothetical protein P7K49_009116 [Saguinus oedipus]